MHNLLLSNKPSEAVHDASLCPLCVDDDITQPNDTIHGGGDVTTYTKEELDSAVAEAVAPLRDELEALKASQDEAAIEARINEMTEAHEAQVAEIQGQLDTAKAELEAAVAKYDELIAMIEQSEKDREAAEALEARRVEVKAAVADTFNEEYVEANLDRWASLDAEAFEAILADWKAAAKAMATDKDGKETLVSTAMEIGSGDGDEGPSVSDIRRGLHRNRNEVRRVGATRST
jgi:DNA repair exonuclease SbcCD ATPase subunit